MRNSDTADPFDTEQIRARVLDAWRATPARFREDANTEEDFALGGYRDRLVVELLQNAADAARATGDPGRVRIEVHADRLVVANTGQPLDREAVASLATLRASTKRDNQPSAGRFGVGFAAVLSVSDEPRVLSRNGGVRFSAARTAAEVVHQQALADELQRRDGHVPVLRLPYIDDEPPPDSYDSAVVLPYRDDSAAATARVLCEDLDSSLLLALPALSEVVIVIGDGEPRRLLAERHDGLVVISDAGAVTSWRTVRSGGELSGSLLTDRPTEERARTSWSVLWALPVDDGGGPTALPANVERVVHAPTPTAEPLDLEALLVATFPLDSSRRHVEASAVTEFLVDQAGQTYAELVAQVARDVGPATLALVPRPSLGGRIDTALRRSIASSLTRRRWVTSVSAAEPVTPERAVVLQPSSSELVAALGELVDGLVPDEWARGDVLTEVLGATSLPLADVIEQLAAVERPPTWWHGLYDALVGVDSALLDGLPVPLVDGRLVRGARSCILPADDATAWSALGLRVIHPDATHPLLMRLGARPGDARAVLADAELHARLAASSADHAEMPDERAALARAVLAVVDDAGLRPGEEPALSVLSVPSADGVWVEAGEAVLPGSPLASVVTADVPIVEQQFVNEVGESALLAVGALASLSVTPHHDVLTEADAMDALIVDGGLWADHVASLHDLTDVDGAIVLDLQVVNGLDLVRDDAWSHVWPVLSDPQVRRAIVEPVAVVLGHGERVLAPSLAGWWLSDVQLFDAWTPRQCRLEGDDRLVGLYEPLPTWVDRDDQLLAALGVATSLEVLMQRPGGVDDLLERLVEADAEPTAAALNAIYRALSMLDEAAWPDPPEQLRVTDGTTTEVVSADEVTIVVAPHHAVFVAGPVIAGPGNLAAILDLPTTADAADAVTVAEGVERPVPAAVIAAAPAVPVTYREHDEIVVKGRSVDWWVGADDVVHAATLDGLARGLAWVTGEWWRRWELSALVAEPERAAQDGVDRAFDTPH